MAAPCAWSWRGLLAQLQATHEVTQPRSQKLSKSEAPKEWASRLRLYELALQELPQIAVIGLFGLGSPKPKHLRVS